MMVLSALRPDASLPEFLAHRARSAPISRLVLDIVAGMLGLYAVLLRHPTGSLVLGSIAVCFAAYGSWGIADRARSGRPASGDANVTGLLDAVCALIVGVGGVAVAALLFGVWSIALGTWIS
ncbi:MAG: hypothetical protein ABI408_12455 [Gemmatimonadaceae bacterium]